MRHLLKEPRFPCRIADFTEASHLFDLPFQGTLSVLLVPIDLETSREHQPTIRGVIRRICELEFSENFSRLKISQ